MTGSTWPAVKKQPQFAILMMGMPGSGKGYQCRILEGKGWTHIGIGALLRAEARRKSRVGRRVRECIATGGVVPDGLVTDLLRDALKSAGTRVAFDGYPRHRGQIAVLNSLLGQLSSVLPIYLSVTEATASDRVKQRVVCPVCDWVGSRSRDKLCGFCGEEMESRDDDIDPRAVERRLRLFRIETMPTICEYACQGQLVVIEGGGTPSAVTHEIAMAISRKCQELC
jgi:adenylate kinase family enzyme